MLVQPARRLHAGQDKTATAGAAGLSFRTFTHSLVSTQFQMHRLRVHVMFNCSSLVIVMGTQHAKHEPQRRGPLFTPSKGAAALS